MSKFSRILVLSVLVLSLCGCRNKNISDDVYEDCKTAVSITDDFLNKFTDSEDAKLMLEAIDCDYNFDYSDNVKVCDQISSLEMDFFWYNLKYDDHVVTTNDIKEKKEKLVELCGL